MKTITKQTTITTERGTVVNMTTTASRGFEMVKRISYCDGDNVEIVKGEVTNDNTTILTINGKDYNGYFSVLNARMSSEKGCYAIFGNVGLSERSYNLLMAVVNEAKLEAETDQSWIEYKERKAKAEKEEGEYYANKKAVENAMTLNGRTY